MFKGNLTRKSVLGEVSIIVLSLIWYYFSNLQNRNLSADFIVNLVFILLLVLLLFFRNSSVRHMYFAFAFVFLSAISNAFGFDNFVYITSGLAVSMLILGVINMILFLHKNPEDS